MAKNIKSDIQRQLLVLLQAFFRAEPECWILAGRRRPTRLDARRSRILVEAYAVAQRFGKTHEALVKRWLARVLASFPKRINDRRALRRKR